MKCDGNAVARTEGRVEVFEWISNVRTGSTHVAGSLRLVRLLSGLPGPDADLLEDALPRGRTSVAEVAPGGVVGLIRVTHGGDLPLLLLDGEQILGARQNRVLNASFLVGPGQTVDLSVSCVERRRWTFGGRGFRPSETTLSALARAEKLRHVQRSLGARGEYSSDQRAVWKEVDAHLARSGVASPTAAFDDAYRLRRGALEVLLSTCQPIPRQIGIAALCGEQLVVLELLGSAALYARAWKKILRGLLCEVYDELSPPDETFAVTTARAALQAMVEGQPARQKSPGLGETLHAASRGFVLVATVDDEVLYHAIATEDAG